MRLSCPRWSQIVGFKHPLKGQQSCSVLLTIALWHQLSVFFIPGDNSCVVLLPVVEGGRLGCDAPGRRAQPGMRNDRYNISLTEHGEKVKCHFQVLLQAGAVNVREIPLSKIKKKKKKIRQNLTLFYLPDFVYLETYHYVLPCCCVIIPTKLNDAFVMESKPLQLWKNQFTVCFLASEMHVNIVLNFPVDSEHLQLVSLETFQSAWQLI